MMETAPLYTDVARAPDGGVAYWLDTDDGVRIRVGVWNEGTKGTVLLMPGRTEYIEKYGLVVGDLRQRGYATIVVDWRGQGLADRMLDDPDTGHVLKFADYQRDMTAMVQAARDLEMPQPFYMLSHSMGGCIALRSLVDGLEVKASVFSAPMWGILIGPVMRPLARGIAWATSTVGMGHKYAPGTSAQSYVSVAPFEDNLLTTDPDMYALLQEQVAAHPRFALGGPSMNWLFEALTETRNLMAMAAPKVPTLTLLGTNERIVDTAAVIKRMQDWPDGQLERVEGAEHEVLMEGPEIRTRLIDQTVDLFGQYS